MNLDNETNKVSGSLLNHRFRFLGQKWRFLKRNIESDVTTIDSEKNRSSRFRDKKIKQEVEKAEAIAADNILLPDIAILKPKNPTKRRVSFADQQLGGNLLDCLPVEPESEERPVDDLASSNLSKLTQFSGLQENSMDCDFDTIELQISLKHIKAMYKDGQTNGIDRVTSSSTGVTDSPRANYSYCFNGSETTSQKSEDTPRPPSAPNSSRRKSSSKNGRSFVPSNQEGKLNKKLNALQSQVADSFIAKSWKKFAIEKGIRVPECVKNVNIEGDTPENR